MLTRRQILLSAAAFPVAAMLSPRGALAELAPVERPVLEVDSAMKTLLEQDARAAWEFFARKTRAIPGMVPANIWSEGGNNYGSYDIATMWDTGSIILATLSARTIGLIDEREFSTRINGIRTFLQQATYKHRSAALPNFRSRVDNASAVERGYDATDTGRLYVALSVLDKATGGRFEAKKVLAGWNVAQTVKDGKIHDVKGGQMSPAQYYIYRYYVSRGYNLASVAHDPVYAGASPDSSAEARAAFVAELAGIGPISTEPSIIEELELGRTPVTNVIAEELDRAQRRRYEETKKFTCVSEGPIDADPWFTYQGYDLAREGEAAWTVYPSVTHPKWATPEFAERYRMVSTKAAFAWFASRPSAYTEALWRHARDGARARQHGFHPGIYEASGKPPANIDVNTNAIVLESVAFVLNGRKPLAEAILSA